MSIRTGRNGKMSAALGKVVWEQCETLCQSAELKRVHGETRKNEIHYQASTKRGLVELAIQLAIAGYFLVTLVANDEQGLRDCGRFCLYYVFSHPDIDLFLSVAYILPDNDQTYPSLQPYFASVEPFEREIDDLLGLRPQNYVLTRNHGARLHPGCYPEHLYPLRRDRSLAEIRQTVRDYFANLPTLPHTYQEARNEGNSKAVADGEMLLSVGPVHAGTIEPGHFLFHLDGEKVRQLDITLGYTHKGVERLFQEYTIEDERAVQLAEFVSGDSAFAHSLAFCRAVENLTDRMIPTPIRVARRLFLELERISNHIGDCAALAHDVGIDVVASDLSMLRERMLELCQQIGGHRLLLGINVPRGIKLPAPIDPLHVGSTVQSIVHEFSLHCQKLSRKRLWKSRAKGIGILENVEAQRLGTTGMIARASGILRDFRLTHPDSAGIYSPPILRQQLIERYNCAHLASVHMIDSNEPNGDINARFYERVRQVDLSTNWVMMSLKRWRSDWHEQGYRANHIAHSALTRQLAIGYVESWRGEIVYWLMVDPSGQIFRCKVRDPSMLNWPALEAAVCGNYLSDFPLINKSFNQSYAGNDL